MKKMKPITRTVNLIIIVSLVLGLGLTIAYFSYNQNTELLATNQNNLHQQSDILYQSVKNAMLPGNAPVAVSLFNDIKDINPTYEIMLFRSNGVEAFSDNSTIETVNKNITEKVFDRRSASADSVMTISGSKAFDQTVAMRKTSSFQEQEGHETFFTIYKPLLNLPKCAVCHGSDHTVRGVIKISSNITSIVQRQKINTLIAGAFFIFLVLILTAFLTQFFKKKILQPVKHIGAVCSSVTGGDFNCRVEIENRDEIGVLGETVNTMVQGLYERFQLSKFVSSSTIDSLSSKKDGVKESITLFFSDIRSFTAYSEKKTPEEVVVNLNKILAFQTQIIHENGGDVDKYVGDEIVALFSGKDKEINACRSALLIQKELNEKSADVYDGLTVGIGINTGEVILGMIGSEERADFTVIGDHVNYASRLCDAAKAGEVIISESVYRNLNGRIKVSRPYKIKVKGKEKFHRVYLLSPLKDGDV